MKLTQKQEAFCLAYVKTGNASEAYRQAYNAEKMKPETVNNKAYVLLKRGDITARIDELNKAAVTDAVMTRQEALERLSKLSRIDLADLIEFGTYAVGESETTGEPIEQSVFVIKDSALQDPEKMAAISELTATRDGIKIKTHSPLQAIQQLAKMQGWESAVKIDHSSKDGTMSPKGRSLSDFYEDSGVPAKPEPE